MNDYVRPEILAMPGYVPGEQPREGEAVKLNTNENPYRASESVYDAIRAVCDKGLSRYPSATAEPFRQAASEILGVPADSILCGNGSDDILTILTRSFVPQGGLLRLASPSYILYKSLAEIQGAAAEEIFFQPDWSLPDYFGREVEPESPFHRAPVPHRPVSLAYLPNPNSPSGTILSNDRLDELAHSLPCPLVVDEAYADFAETNALELVRRNPKVIVTRTLSKSYALAGLRFGFLVARPEIVEQLMKVKDSYNCDAVAIAAATAAIRDQPWRLDNRRKILAVRKKLTVGMRRLGFVVPDSHANFTWNVHHDPTVSHLEIYKFLKRNGWLVRYMNYGGQGDGLRVSVGTDEQIDAVLRLLGDYFTRR